MDDFPVDIVYTWVDGSDKKWLSKKNKALKEYNNFHKSFEVSGVKRFIDKDELKFSLRSIAKYCPWVRNIYLVTDNQIPDWLNQSKANIIVINHNDLFEDQRYYLLLILMQLKCVYIILKIFQKIFYHLMMMFL